MDCFSCEYHEAVCDGYVIKFCECKHPLNDKLDFHYDYCPTVDDHIDNCPYYKA